MDGRGVNRGDNNRGYSCFNASPGAWHGRLHPEVCRI